MKITYSQAKKALNAKYFQGKGVKWIISDKEHNTVPCTYCGNHANGVITHEREIGNFVFPLCKGHARELYPEINFAPFNHVVPLIKKNIREAPYFDKKSKEIKQNSLLKIFHFKGVNEQGRGRKNYYMYKLAELNDLGDKKGKFWIGRTIDKDMTHTFYLMSIANKDRVLEHAEILNN